MKQEYGAEYGVGYVQLPIKDEYGIGWVSVPEKAADKANLVDTYRALLVVMNELEFDTLIKQANSIHNDEPSRPTPH